MMDEREWVNKGKELSVRLIEYNKQYRQKICTKCSKERQKKRRCLRFRGNETHCEHLIRARTQKFRKEIQETIMSYPSFIRPNIKGGDGG